MKYFPYENFYITTLLTPTGVQECLDSEVNPSSGVEGTPSRYFEGEVWQRNFKFTPRAGYRNSFSPKIAGKVEAQLNGSRIHVTMEMQPVVLGVWGFVLFAMLTTFQLVFRVDIIHGRFKYGMLLILALMGLVYCLGLIPFKRESNKARKQLTDMFNGEAVDIKQHQA